MASAPPPPLTPLQQRYLDLVLPHADGIPRHEIERDIRRMNAAELRQAIAACEGDRAATR